MYTPNGLFEFVATDYTPSSTFVFAEATDVIGTANYTLDDVVMVAVGTVTAPITSGTVNYTLDDVTMVAIGTVIAPIYHTVFDFRDTNYTPYPVFDFNGDLIVSGSVNYTLDDVIGVGVGSVINAFGSVHYTLDDVIGSAIAHVANDGVVNYTLDDVIGAGVGSIINTVGSSHYTLDDVIGSGQGIYDINVHRVTATQSITIIQQAQPLICNIQTQINIFSFNQVDTLALLNDTLPIVVKTDSWVIDLTALWFATAITQEQANPLTNATLSIINTVVFNTQNTTAKQQQATPLSYGTLSVQDVLTFNEVATALSLADMSQQTYALLKAVYSDSVNPYTPHAAFNFTDTNYSAIAVFDFGTQAIIELCEAQVHGIYSTSHHATIAPDQLILRHFCALLTDTIKPPFGTSPHIDRPRPPPEPPTNQETLTIPTKEAYTVHHTISVVTVIGNHPVPLSKLSLSYDVDSFAWVFGGVLADKAALSLVTMTDDVPVQLSITINGYNWIVLIEKIPEQRSFGKTDITLQGRSLSALLGSPYQRLTSYTAGSELTVQQIADSLLPTGWTINWQCATPWVVPTNSFSYTQQTLLQALATIAQSIGAVLVPSRNTQVLTMQPRYPVLPWNFHASGINADLVIPDSAIASIGVESRTQSPINGVYVHGEKDGVLAFCRLTGTAGDVLAPTVSNSLITDVVAARALGERLLAGQATQPVTTSVTTFLGGDFPLARVGWLLEVNNERAIINGVAINVEFGKVSQTITVGENTTNAYSKLLNLLPAQPLLVGQLVSTVGDVSILTLLDGGVITARGSGTVGANYYVRNGLIESAAPNLGMNEIVI